MTFRLSAERNYPEQGKSRGDAMAVAPRTGYVAEVLLSSRCVVCKSWGSTKEAADKSFIDVGSIRNIQSYVLQLSSTLFKGVFG